MDSPSSAPHTYNTGSSPSSLPVTTKTLNVPSSPYPETLDSKAGESSEILCGLCLERKETEKTFTVETCKHSFCSDCINSHVASKINDGRHIVSCPGLDCKSVIELEACTAILPKSIVEKWNESLFEALMKEQQWKMCPKCTSYVQKTKGCLRITCRCNYRFCYSCGEEWTEEHRVSCQNDEEDEEDDQEN